jgi:GH15 family glucan-1,4-alpha-glucosidase
MRKAGRYPDIGDYALIGDCHAAALVSSDGSIDWCCLPRFDARSCFGRLLDWQLGGYCAITPSDEECSQFRRYLGDTLVLETTFRTPGGEARLIDCFTMHTGGRNDPYRQILRIIEGVRGRVPLHLRIAPRFDYGAIKPWLRREGVNTYAAIGGSDALVIRCDAPLTLDGQHDITAEFTVRAGERIRLSMQYRAPEELNGENRHPIDSAEIDRRLDETIAWWETWSAQVQFTGPDAPGVLRSAITLKALTYAPTGAIVAAPTSSLPETPRGVRNWDYRYSWIRDSTLSVDTLGAIGCATEADHFRQFIQRSAAGSATNLQVMYGIGGEHRLTEFYLEDLEGYREAKPVRVGNAAANQLQLDAYGFLVDLSWRWYHQQGYTFDDDYWRFLVDLIDTAAERWEEPDCGIWEVRSEPQHFVYSKALCWAALDRGIRLADACMRKAPVRRWTRVRNQIRAAIEKRGYDKERGIFTQTFDGQALDAALLVLPSVGFVEYEDPRMVRTADAIHKELCHNGLIRRYRIDQTDDGLVGEEGTFLACSFWLAECFAHQGRIEEARHLFDRAVSCDNDLGLFAEEYDPETDQLQGNFPQGLTHLAHISAAVALDQLIDGVGDAEREAHL